MINEPWYPLRAGLLPEIEALKSNPMHKTYVSIALPDLIALAEEIKSHIKKGTPVEQQELELKLASMQHPRVTEESIKAKIKDAEYLRYGTTTICMITMQNGFRFVGHSTPVSPANFDPTVGDHYAYENAFKQIWPYEGYLLREQLSK